ncbi:MAG: hypothetical protein KDB61_07935, partial [Planctomycetes bacterium]|nr:hypothetical protein [Planctomycetota bacterium]
MSQEVKLSSSLSGVMALLRMVFGFGFAVFAFAFSCALLLSWGWNGSVATVVSLGLACVVGLWVSAFIRAVLDSAETGVFARGGELVFKKRGKTVLVPFSEIKKITYQRWISPPEVRVFLENKTEFGRE